MLQDTTDRNTSIPMSAHDRSSPFGGLFFVPDGCNIAPGTAPPSKAVSGNSENFEQRFSGADFCCRQTTASCTFVRQRCSLCEAGAAP